MSGREQGPRWLVAMLPGDGIGAEVAAQAERVLQAVAKRYGFEAEVVAADIGGVAIDNHGDPLPESTLDLCQRADAVFLGAVGHLLGERDLFVERERLSEGLLFHRAPDFDRLYSR